MTQITIDMNEEDFARLAYTSMQWVNPDGTNDWIEQEARFEVVDPRGSEIDWSLGYVFWVGMEYSSVILARAFLESQGARCQVLWDQVENPDPSYMVVTDHVTKTWADTMAALSRDAPL